MVTSEKNRAVTFQANKELVSEAMTVLNKKNLTLSSALRLFLQNVVVTNEVDLLTEEELEKEKLFKQFQAEINKNIEDVRQGKFYTSEEVRSELGL
ncbi:type II toxin-antitoxin system RelB/ParD family antitoxin [Streptococcus agalactiae]|uniref:type II toxin-antitoxin system RelB/ParD family antitoxin n=1 Tax=Streptococcus agalactiae TaxID=1311 RepID=UPI0034A3591F